MYDYHADIVWSVNIALVGINMITAVAIFASALFKDYLWQRRQRALLKIKKNVYEIVLAGESTSRAVSRGFVCDLTPQQFIDIETNRMMDSAFFNDSEQQFFRSCSIDPEMLSKFEKIAVTARNKWHRIEAILALGYTHAKSSMGILGSSLLNNDKDVAYFSMISLGQMKTIQSAEILLELILKDPSNGYKVISILEDFPKEISGAVIKLTEHYDPLVKYWALRLLSKLEPSSYIKQLERLTQDESAEVRSTACDCLGSIGSRDASPALLKCMKDDSWLVRSHAVLAYGKVLGDSALPEVSKLINDASWSVLDAVREVMTSHIKASLPYIERFLASEDEIAKKCSVIALENSGYLAKLLNIAVSEGDKDAAICLLRGVISSRYRFGLDAAISHLNPAMRAKALEAMESTEKI